jgi:hypothetical protein
MAPARPSFGVRLALGLTGSLAAAFAVLLVLFVARPAIPGEIHAALAGRAPAEGERPTLQQLLERVATPVEADQAFVESWTARQPRGVGVRSMEAERLFSVRQFELTDGKRMLVFTELEDDRVQPAVMHASTPARTF